MTAAEQTAGLAKAAAEEYLREIDGCDFGDPEHGHDVQKLQALIERAIRAGQKLVERGHVDASAWQVYVENPGQEAYHIGSQHDSLEVARYYRDMCLEPRRGHRSKGFSKKVKFRIYRIDTVRTEEV